MTMTLIETKTLGTAAPSIEFTSIPQTFTDLLVLVSGRSTATSASLGAYAEFRPNSSTSGLSSRALRGVGSGSGQSNPETFIINRITPSNYTASTFSNSSIYIPNYAGATNKSVFIDSVLENDATEGQQELVTGLWTNAAAITSFLIVPGGGNFATGTMVSLYGIGPNTSTAAAKATGGTIQKVGNYFVHTFTSSGTFTPTTNLTNVEYVVVAGGGNASRGAGGVGSGGGGGGGYRSSVVGENSGGGSSAESRLSLTSGVGYTVTVGAGGNNSVFSTITSLAGGYTATTGGSGGGGNQSFYGAPGAGTTGQGTSGGGASTSNFAGAGGGGASTAAASFTTNSMYGGTGGAGQTTAISGAGITYGGGGGGSGFDGGGGGGLGGGGNGGTSSGASDGAINTGGGAGAGRSASADKTGGSGIVIVRYPA